MPIYEYQCENENCGNKVECLQKISDEPLKTCPACKEDSLKKLISAAGFRLKGSGWYETDFKSNKDKQKNLSTNNASNDHACSNSTCCNKVNPVAPTATVDKSSSTTTTISSDS